MSRRYYLLLLLNVVLWTTLIIFLDYRSTTFYLKVNFNHLKKNVTSHKINTNVKSPSVNTDIVTSQLPACFSNSNDDVIQGEWVRHEDLKKQDFEKRIELDKLIRVSMNWAPSLYITDGRCGEKVKIPGYRLFAQCNPYGNNPCCNQKTGYCGNGPANCNCLKCTNFNAMVSAELAKWQPKKCNLEGLKWKDSCSLLQKKNISLYFLGDSLIRHVHTTLILHLTNNYNTGAIPQNASKQTRQDCKGIKQITLRECSIESVAQSTDELEQGSLCNGSYGNFKIEMVQDYHTTLIPKVSKTIDSIMNKENAWIIGGVGLHYQLNFPLLKKQYLDKVINKFNASRNGWPKMLWIENHGISGFLREVAGASNIIIRNFNRRINQYLSLNNIPILKTFDMSKGVTSYDGRHYGVGFNKLKVKLLMNFLKQFYQKQQS